MSTIFFWGPKTKGGFMSNFYPISVALDKKVWRTTEHYFQAMKWVGVSKSKVTQIFYASTPTEAKRLGNDRRKPIRKDWEEVKEDIMLKALRAKFTQNPDMKQALLDTGDARLVENSPVDTYWGIGKEGDGLNRLGALLEQVREELNKM